MFIYLGYPGTTGLSVFAGRITDAWVDPWDTPARAGPEPFIRVAGGCLAFKLPDDAPAPHVGARTRPCIFSSFNDALKLNEGRRREAGSHCQSLLSRPCS